MVIARNKVAWRCGKESAKQYEVSSSKEEFQRRGLIGNKQIFVRIMVAYNRALPYVSNSCMNLSSNDGNLGKAA